MLLCHLFSNRTVTTVIVTTTLKIREQPLVLDSSDLANLGVFTLGCMQGFEAIVPGFSSLTKVILSLGIQVPEPWTL